MKVNLRSYDWIVVNSSAGKDSQTMLAVIVERCKAEGIPLERIVVVHCDLETMEWKGTKELAQQQAEHYGLRFEVVCRKQGDILDHVIDRHAKLKADGKTTTAPFPSSAQRWCTSDHKRDQVKRLMTKLTNETRLTDETKLVRILNCQGMRSAESPARAKLRPFRLDKLNTNGKRRVHIWLPIFDWSEGQVWEHIRARPVPHHYAYDLGMGRLSCCFCIFAPWEALMLAGKHNRPLLDRYCDVEEQTGFAFRVGLPLVEVRNALDRGEEPGPISSWEMP